MRIRNIIVIGASTGGPETLRKLLTNLPVLDAGILIVQHMPIYVNESVREEIGSEASMEIRLAKDGDRLQNGLIYLAPSLVHMELVSNLEIKLVEGEKVNFVRPAIDVTMKSLKPSPSINFIGVVLTGMGEDGARGISHIKKELRGKTIAQDQSTCVIYGMPKAAAETGDVDFVLPLGKIPMKIVELVGSVGASENTLRNSMTAAGKN